jgi:trehalose 6-phosphate synthase
LHCRNFVESVERTLEARVEREDTTIVHGGCGTAVRAYPISIDWRGGRGAEMPPVEVCRCNVRNEFNLSPDTPLIVCFDRLDYTKGFEERLLSFRRLLDRFCGHGRRPVLLQVAAPSRRLIERHRTFSDRIAMHVEALNERFGGGSYRPVLFINRHCDRDDIVRYYRAADVCYVSSLHDGMNLVAKEFVAARDDEDGILLLSRFAGAARELSEALVVNPYDIDGVADLMAAALAMCREERRVRMRAMRTHVAAHNVYRWAGEMLADASRHRERERLHGRLSIR